MRVIAFVLLSFASRTPPRLKKSTYALRVQLFALATCAIIDGKRLRARLGALPRYLKRTHALRNHIFGETDAPAALVRGARQPHGMKFGQSSLKHIDRTAPLVRGARQPHRMSARSIHLNRTERRRQRPWLHDAATLTPVRGVRGERLAERGGRVRGRVLASTHVTPSTRLVTQV